MKPHLLVLCLAIWPVAWGHCADLATDAGIDGRLGQALPMDDAFVDQRGQPVTLRDVATGTPLVIAPVYFNCPNLCDAQLATLFMTLDNSGYRPGRDYQLVAFSFNSDERPADARAKLAELARRWPDLAQSPAVHFLTGPEPSSQSLSQALGFHYRRDDTSGQYAHSSAIATVTRDGHLSRWLYGLGYQGNDVRLAITEAGQGRVGSVKDRLLLLCAHFDPRTGGYDDRVLTLLRTAGVLTCVLIAGGIALALRRERKVAKS